MIESKEALRNDLNAEYHGILRTVSEFDGRLLTVKSWSVTTSLAGIGLGFQQEHYSLFAVASGAAACFWITEAVTKRHQMRYYPRMREIEVATAELNSILLAGTPTSSPQIDWKWDDRSRGMLPQLRQSQKFSRQLLLAPFLPHVAIPAGVIIIAGLILFFLGAAGNFGDLKL